MALRPALRGALLAVVVLMVLATIGTVVFLKTTGLSARAKPGSFDTAVARRLRALAVPGDYQTLKNPVLRNEESIRSGMAHFADHCATCHANNGSGETEVGKAMFPPAPDMRLPDGEALSWHLVNFIRHLPRLTEAEEQEMADMNPRAPADVRQEIEEQRFLAGEDLPARTSPVPHTH